MKLIEDNIAHIRELCRKYKVKKLYVFGSILTDRFNEKSDVDFSALFDRNSISREHIDWADLFFDFIHDLEKLLGRKVDMVFDDYIKNKTFQEELNTTKLLIYG